MSANGTSTIAVDRPRRGVQEYFFTAPSIAASIRVGNDSEFGLTAFDIAGSEIEAEEMGRRIDAETIFLPDTFLVAVRGPMVGITTCGHSGVGRNRTGKAQSCGSSIAKRC